jgi:hypothetical protein
VTIKPTRKLRQIIATTYDGSLNAAAEAWNIKYNSLRRFMEGHGCLQLGTAMEIANRLGLPLEDLFSHD